VLSRLLNVKSSVCTLLPAEFEEMTHSLHVALSAEIEEVTCSLFAVPPPAEIEEVTYSLHAVPPWL
jgi:hypothetical protein